MSDCAHGARGFITVAVGSRSWLEAAVDCALSLRAHDALPVALVCDAALAEHARQDYQRVFDDIVVAPPGEPVRAKLGLDQLSPFRESIFVDADAIALASLDRYFAPLGAASACFIAESVTLADEDLVHHGRSVHGIIRRFGLRSYLKTNAGFFAFRRDAAPLFAGFRRAHDELSPRLLFPLQGALGARVPIEFAIGLAGDHPAIASYVDDQPMMWSHQLATLDLASPPGRLLHHIGFVPPATFHALLRGMEARRAAAGLVFPNRAWWLSRNARLRWRRTLRAQFWLNRVRDLDRYVTSARS